MSGRVLVTGASGMIGRAVCHRLAADGVQVLRAGRSAHDDIAWSAGDSLSQRLGEVDSVVHLAARVHVRGKGFADSAAFDAINARATLQLAREAVDSGVSRFVFLSSIGVLGGTSREPFGEEAPARPHTRYAESKWQAECGLRELSGIDTVILRPPAVIGGDARGNLRSIVAAIRRGLPLPFGSIANARHFVSLENLVDAIMLTLREPAAAGETFHVANPEALSTRTLCEIVASTLDVAPRLWPCPPALLRAGLTLSGRRSLADGLTGDLLVDTRKIRATLGWAPRESLPQSIRRAVEEMS